MNNHKLKLLLGKYEKEIVRTSNRIVKLESKMKHLINESEKLSQEVKKGEEEANIYKKPS